MTEIIVGLAALVGGLSLLFAGMAILADIVIPIVARMAGRRTAARYWLR